MYRSDWPIQEYGIRPAGSQDRCFFCGQPRGAQHADSCVIRQRTVVVRTIVEHAITVPQDWGAHLIEFTEGSSCSDNMIVELGRLVDRLDASGQCTCGMVTREFIREATEEDEEISRLYVAQVES